MDAIRKATQLENCQGLTERFFAEATAYHSWISVELGGLDDFRAVGHNSKSTKIKMQFRGYKTALALLNVLQQADMNFSRLGALEAVQD